MPDGTQDSGKIYVWAAMAFLGSLVGMAKNRRFSERALRLRITLTDLGVILAALVLIGILPSRSAILEGALLALFAGYLWWYLHRFPELTRRRR